MTNAEICKLLRLAHDALAISSEKHEWLGLTDEEICREYQSIWSFHPRHEPELAKDTIKLFRALEALLKERNT